MENQIDRRGKSMWYAYAACVILFPVAALSYGPLGLIVGIIATAIGVERIAAIWSEARRAPAVAFMLWVGVGAVSLMLPIWGHDRVTDSEGTVVVSHHKHHLWDRDHVR